MQGYVRELDHSHSDRMKKIKQFDIEYPSTKKSPVFFQTKRMFLRRHQSHHSF